MQGSDFTSRKTGPTATVTLLPPPAAPVIQVSKTASVATVFQGGALNYTILLKNTGNATATVSTVRDTLPLGFSHTSSSSSGLTTANPTINGQQLRWTGSWNIPASGSATLSFGVLGSSVNGVYQNKAFSSGSNFTAAQSGPTAPVTVISPPPGFPVMSLVKTVSSTSVTSGSIVTYTMKVGNSGNQAGTITDIYDILPTGFTYQAGSTTGLVTTNPTINGLSLHWPGNWVIMPGVSNQTLAAFQTKAPLVSDTYYNNASIAGQNFTTLSTGPTASVHVTTPHLIMTKTVNSDTAIPGDTMTYTVTYLNIGEASTAEIRILENIPVNTNYRQNSASGTNMVITYSHDGGVSYDADQSAPVTQISFIRTVPLMPAGSGAVSFDVIIN